MWPPVKPAAPAMGFEYWNISPNLLVGCIVPSVARALRRTAKPASDRRCEGGSKDVVSCESPGKRLNWQLVDSVLLPQPTPAAHGVSLKWPQAQNGT